VLCVTLLRELSRAAPGAPCGARALHGPRTGLRAYQDDPVELRVGAELKLIKALKLTGSVSRGMTDGAADWGVSAGLTLRF